MQAVIASKRVDIMGGMWAPKVGGEFAEGDPATTHFFVEGKAEIKELAGHLKLFFTNVKCVKRNIFLTDAEKEAIIKVYREGVEKGHEAILEEGGDLPDDAAEKAKEDEALPELFAESLAKKDQPIPSRLNVYLTRRKPKTRMTDAHKSGSRIHCNGNQEGLFGKPETTGTFQVSLKDIPDALAYPGLVVLKLPQDKPVTNEPIIYGMIKLSSARTMKIKTGQALHLTEIKDSLDKVLAAADPNQKGGKRANDSIKPMHYYSHMASKAWLAFQKPQDEEVEFETFARMLDACNIFMVEAQAKRAYKAVDVDGSGEVGLSEFENFLMAYDVLGTAAQDLAPLDIYDTLKVVPDVEHFGEFGNHEGMDISGFLEAVDMLGTQKDTTEQQILQAFCFGAGIRESKMSSTFLTHAQFKKAWLKVADLEKEMTNRKLKYDSSALAQGRNRDRMYRIITDQEEAYLANLEKINDVVEGVKRERRHHKDDKKRERDAHREHLEHQAQKFVAIRGQEKRLLMKQEQEEKNKKKFEERTLRANLLKQQQENREKARADILKNRNESDKLRVDEIKAQGLDRIDLSIQNLREIAPSLYDNVVAQTKLSYLVSVDFSRNLLEDLPEKNFLYWMTETRRWRISQNRFKKLPDELGYMIKLEILEAETNRLESIPSTIGLLTALQRLDISNNKLVTLPEGLGTCASLRYFCAHSNNLRMLPNSMGGCFRLEYIDISKNHIRELPEDLSHMASLTHFDASSNRIGHLPRDLGNCSHLTYLDFSTNILVFLPETFSRLVSLEVCNFENNELIMQPDRFNTCSKLKRLILKRNHSTHLTGDLGTCTQLARLDASLNKIEEIPPELGLMTVLQELDLSYNRLSTIPPELGSCAMLQKLLVSHNLIEGCMPNTIGLVASLRFLDISFNKIDEMPRSIIGLKLLEELIAERCYMNALPDTITTLEMLHKIDLSNNRFTRFPIELKDMKVLRDLNMANNSIPLLPRNIDTMTNLESLNLKKNQLRALPVEFVSVLESVPTVVLDSNPWTDLPPRWGKLWTDRKAVDGPRGYAVPEAVDFLYGMQSFYDAAEGIWQELGVFHYTNRLGFSDFIEELRRRIPKTWHEGLVDYVKHVYFTARQTGVYPRWYSLDEEDVKHLHEESAAIKATDAKRRDLNVQRAREDDHGRLDRMAKAYDVEPLRKANRENALTSEHTINEQILQNMAMAALHHCIVDREEKFTLRVKKREEKQEAIAKAETRRLVDILATDREMMLGGKTSKKKKKSRKTPSDNKLPPA